MPRARLFFLNLNSELFEFFEDSGGGSLVQRSWQLMNEKQGRTRVRRLHKLGMETYYSVKRDLLQCQKRPACLHKLGMDLVSALVLAPVCTASALPLPPRPLVCLRRACVLIDAQTQRSCEVDSEPGTCAVQWASCRGGGRSRSRRFCRVEQRNESGISVKRDLEVSKET